MKIKKICAALALGGLVLALTACGNSGSSSSKAASAVQPTSQNGKYVPNPTGKPMSEDLKDQLESLHEKEAKSIDTIKELPAGSNKGKKIMIAYFTWGGITGEVAHSIQQKIGGDIYEIKRDPDYSKEYNAVLKEAAAAPGAKIFQGLTLDANTSYNVIDPWLTKAGLM